MGNQKQAGALNCSRVLFRVDSDSKIGAGHLMRCLALANALRRRGTQTEFLSDIENVSLREKILNDGHRLLPAEFRYPDVRDPLGPGNSVEGHDYFDWIVLDGYSFDPEYQLAARRVAKKSLVIDDLCHWPIYTADVILNQNTNSGAIEYPTPSQTLQLRGLKYVLLRGEFLHGRSDIRRTPETGSDVRVLVTVGGVANPAMVAIILDGLARVGEHRFLVRVLTGIYMNEAWERISRNYTHLPNISLELITFVEQMQKPMAWADIAVSAGGSTCWELAFMGVPTLVIVLAKNQEPVAAAIEAGGCGKFVGYFPGVSDVDVARVVSDLAGDSQKMEAMSKSGPNLIDGLGAERVATAMIEFGNHRENFSD